MASEQWRHHSRTTIVKTVRTPEDGSLAVKVKITHQDLYVPEGFDEDSIKCPGEVVVTHEKGFFHNGIQAGDCLAWAIGEVAKGLPPKEVESE